MTTHQKTLMEPVRAWEKFAEEWAVGGKPMAVQRIAKAAFEAGQKADGKWLTREEFEDQTTGNEFIHVCLGGLEVRLAWYHGLFENDAGEYWEEVIDQLTGDQVEWESVTHVKPIHQPDAPEV